MTAHVPVQIYTGLQAAFDSMNKELFGGKLPPCMITLRAASRSYGYYHTGRFVEAHGKKDAKPVSEIALNPTHFAERTPKETLATLGHEMVHFEDMVDGTEPTRCYHGKPWATKMKRIGLHPSDTAKPGGKETGPRVSHYIIKGGAFDKWFPKFMAKEGRSLLLYQDRLATERALGKRKGKGKGGEGEEGEGGEAKSTGRAKFCCKGCGLNAWAKPSAKLRCDDCKRPMRVEESDDD
jgi:hypothetical protein